METILLYLKVTSKEKLKQIALKDNRNVNGFINEAIKDRVEKLGLNEN